MFTATHDIDPHPRPGSRDRVRDRIGLIVCGSLAAGVFAALVLVAAPLLPADEDALTGGVLLGCALGWGLLAALSIRFSQQPQRWAAAPAAVLGLAGGLLLTQPTDQVLGALDWLWPPVLLALVVWMAVGAHRRLRSRTRRWVMYPVLAIMALASIGGGYETVQEAVQEADHPMAGQLVDVGGRRLYLRCTGSGSPTVVLEPGLSEASPAMGWITPAVAANTRVCGYDRAGRGWSDPADRALDGAQTAADLHTLLHRGGVEGPYVLAGHSFGGLYVLAFAAAYPDEVAGLVLIDSTAPAPASGPGQGPPTDTSYDPTDRVLTVVPAAAHLGVGRLLAHISYNTLPPQSRDEAIARAARPSHLRSYADELRQGGNAVRQAAAPIRLEGKPLIVLTAGRGNDATWGAKQAKLATLSTNSLHRVVPDATHGSLVMDPTDAAITATAIRDVVDAVRNSTRLH